MPLEEIAKIVGIVGAVFGGIKFYLEYARSNAQKQEELRWKKAGLAREVLGEMFSDFHSRSALRMLDWWERDYKTPDGTTHSITDQIVAQGLRVVDLDFDDDEQFVRDCFERLYDMTDSMEHFIQTGLLVDHDIMLPLAYYAECIGTARPTHERFWDAYGYDLTAKFFSRFSEYSNPKRNHERETTPPTTKGEQ